MGLENLKSIFSDNAGVNQSLLSGRHNNPDQSYAEYGSLATEFNIDNTPIFETTPITELSTTLNDPSSDIRFSAGIGFPPAKMKLSVATEGAESSLFYINTPTGDTLGISGAINKLGKLSKLLTKAGLDVPNIPFSADLSELFPVQDLRYQNTVFELINGTNTPTNDDAQNIEGEGSNYGIPTFKNPHRGVAFQVLGDNSYDTPVRYGDALPPEGTNLEWAIDPKMGYQPLGTNDPGFTNIQQIDFGVDDDYPYFGYLDSVHNTLRLNITNPILNFTPGNIQFKHIDIGLDNVKSKLSKLSLNNIKDYLDKNIKLKNPFAGVKLSDFKGIKIKFKLENDIIQDIGKSLGGLLDGVSGFGKKFKGPDLSFLIPQGFGSRFAGFGSKAMAFGKKAVAAGSKLADKAAGVAGDVIDFAQKINPIESFTLPELDLQNPFSINKTEFGGQAFFNNNVTSRLPDTTLKPNKPINFSRSISRRVMNPLGGSELGSAVLKQGADQRGYVENDKSPPYEQLGLTKYAGVGNVGNLKPISEYYPNKSMDEKAGGDRMTMAKMLSGKTLSTAGYGVTNGVNVESDLEGYPFYIKDLRNDTYIIFRAYLEGLTEDISPAWTPENYIGRSEPVYIYERAERSVNFTLNLFAQTAGELNTIYDKLRALTSLCYPMYKSDSHFISSTGGADTANVTEAIDTEIEIPGKIRMSPPFISFRIGELFGSNHFNQTGYMKSISYSYPDNSPWEYREGQRVPKFIKANIGFQILHRQAPHIGTRFYGYSDISVLDK